MTKYIKITIFTLLPFFAFSQNYQKLNESVNDWGVRVGNDTSSYFALVNFIARNAPIIIKDRSAIQDSLLSIKIWKSSFGEYTPIKLNTSSCVTTITNISASFQH